MTSYKMTTALFKLAEGTTTIYLHQNTGAVYRYFFFADNQLGSCHTRKKHLYSLALVIPIKCIIVL